jgi:hypothetical protein
MLYPATVRVPTRVAVFGLLATKNFAIPEPVPVLAEVTEIQLTLLAADHPQPADV